jgi:carboxyl-terminal processing protease
MLKVLALGACLSLAHDSHELSASDTDYPADVTFALEQLEAQCGHFFELKDIDWKDVSKEFTKAAKNVENDQEHLVLLVRLLARLEDGHAQVRPLPAGENVKWPEEPERVGPGFFLCKSGKDVLVKQAWGPAADLGIAAGARVVSIDGKKPLVWLEGRVEYWRDRVSFSTDNQAFAYACHWGLAEPKGTRLDVEFEDESGKKRKRTVTYENASVVPNGPVFPPDGLASAGDVFHARTAAGNGYVHVRRCPDDLPQQMDAALAALGDVNGLVLDFRGNSGGGFDHEALFGRFVPSGTTLPFAPQYRSAGPLQYTGPMVVIVDATVRSAGETAAGIFKEDGRAYMIGETNTAGMSSSKTTIDLPSGLFQLYVSVASNKGRFNDGKGIEGIGVVPHEYVAYTSEDLFAKRDTLIVRAEELLADFPQGKVPYEPAR